MFIPLFEKDGFIICFEAHEEDISMRHYFIKECGWSESQYRQIKNYEWFCAEVSAWKNGEKLGNDYLGACCYKTAKDFYTAHDYFPDMVDRAIEEAKARSTPSPSP